MIANISFDFDDDNKTYIFLDDEESAYVTKFDILCQGKKTVHYETPGDSDNKLKLYLLLLSIFFYF